MTTPVTAPRKHCLIPIVGVLLGAAMVVPAFAQQSDRERAQLLQMQQQLQRLKSDNAGMQKERDELQVKAQDAEKARKAHESELNRLRQEVALGARTLADTRAELEAVRQQLASAQADGERLQKSLNENLAQQAMDTQRAEQREALLAARLKFQTERAELCTVRHEAAMKFGTAMIDRYEHERLRLCEPLTGIWKVRNEDEVQQLRGELYGDRLDVPAPAVSPAEPSTAAPRSAPLAH